MSDDNRAESVVKYYVVANKLKQVLRTGWAAWEVKADRLESVAEHVYGVLMLAIAIQSEYRYEIDFAKTLLMLAIHETEEILIGDLTPLQTSREEKQRKGHAAIIEVFAPLADKEKLIELILEFDARETLEAKFAYWCDKMECNLQCRVYDEMGAFRLHGQENNPTVANDFIRELVMSEPDVSSAWTKFTESYAEFDENFLAIDKYATSHKITSQSSK